LCSPSPSARIGIDSVRPTRPVKSRVRLTPRVEWVDRCFAGPWFAGRDGDDFLRGQKGNGGAPFDLADENEVQLGIVSGTVPLGTRNRARTEVEGLADHKRRVLVLHPGDRLPVEQGIGVEIEAVKVAVLRGDHQNLLAAFGLDNGW